jgi:hypothetical protein
MAIIHSSTTLRMTLASVTLSEVEATKANTILIEKN